MAKFRKKPVVIEAVQFNGNNAADVLKFAHNCGARSNTDSKGVYLMIPTLEGMMVAAEGDWIIKGVKGEVYPCKPDIFAATYDAVTD